MNKSALIKIAIAGVVAASIGIGSFFYFRQGETFNPIQTKEVKVLKIKSPRAFYKYDDAFAVDTLQIVFDANTASPQAMLKKNLEGIIIKPEIAGTFSFDDEKTLVFTPEKNWVPGTKYTISLPKEILADDVILKNTSVQFSAPEFSAKTVKSAFYEDPRDLKNKAATATFEFSYPIKEDSVADNVKIKTLKGGKDLAFTYTLDKTKQILHIISEPIKITEKDDVAVISVGSGIKNIYNDVLLTKKTEGRVFIPNIQNFFKITAAQTLIIRDPENDNIPEQFIKLDFTTATDDASLVAKSHFSYCEKNCYGSSPQWKKLKTELVEAENGSTVRLFKYKLETPALLSIEFDKGLKSVEGYKTVNSFSFRTASANLPKEAFISFDGSIIPLQNQKTIRFTSRGVNELTIKVAQIKEEDLNHLATQTEGSFAVPYFINYYFNEDNIATVYEKHLPLNVDNLSKTTYSSVDLTPYLGKRNGIFLIKVYGSENNQQVTPEDRRLITVTDLGAVVKDNVDGTHNVFVADISNNKPADGVKVEVLGKNGEPVFAVTTDSNGAAVLPKLNDFTKEREPVVYKLSKGNDLSFLPLKKNDRVLELSRFDIGGERLSYTSNQIKSFIFSDRGIYRPGETAHFGIMTRFEDLEVPTNVLFKAVIYTPGWKTVAEKSFSVEKQGVNDVSFDIPQNAPLGDYTLSLYKMEDKNKRYIDEIHFNVQEFLPDTMKLNLAFSPENPAGWSDKPDVVIKAKAANLYGTAASGHAINGYYTLRAATFSFEKYKDYTFATPADGTVENFAMQKQALPELTTDENGVANFVIDLNKYARGTYLLRAVISVNEREGGRGVEKAIETLVSPNPAVIGYKTDTQRNSLFGLDKNSRHIINFMAVNNKLERISLDGLKLNILQKKNIRTLALLANGTYGYQLQNKEELISSSSFKISSEDTPYVLNTEKPGKYILILTDNDSKELLRLQYSINGAGNENFQSNKNQNLVLELDKNEYNNGDVIKAQIQAPFTGFGLLTIELDKVYAYKWFKMNSKVDTVDIQLPKGINGNAYLNVALIRDIRAPEIFDSPLSFAVKNFKINHEKFVLPIELEVPDVIKPGETLKVGYKVQHTGDLFVWGVNEGILLAGKYKRPTPLNFFFNKQALQVITRQILDLIMPDINLALQLAAPGGGDGEDGADISPALFNPFARKVNKPTAFWSGVLQADDTIKYYSYDVPQNFNGTIKVMAAGANGSQFGSVEKNVLVRGDFALTPAMPLFAAPGDEFKVGVSVSNLIEGSGKQFPVVISVQTEGSLKVIGDNSVTVYIDENNENSASFTLAATDEPAASKITFTAQALNDAAKKFSLSEEISVRPAMPFMTDIQAGSAKSSVTLKDFALDFYDTARKQNIFVSSSPLILAKGLLSYLRKYPHMCTEQSISKIFPAVAVFFNQPRTKANAYVESDFIYDTYDNVIAKLAMRQRFNGGFSMWNTGESEEFISLYALEFLVTAKEYGFNVEEGMFERAADYATKIAQRVPVNAEDSLPAYAVYVLTLTGRNTSSLLLNLEEQLNQKFGKAWKQNLNGVYMAAASRLSGYANKADEALGKYQFGKDAVSDARYIYTLRKVFKDKELALSSQQIEALLKPLKEHNFNTISSAYAILALSTIGSIDDDLKASLNNQPMARDKTISSTSFDNSLKKAVIKADTPFFYVVEQEGFLKELPTKAVNHGIEVAKTIKPTGNQKLDSLKPGDEVVVTLALKNTTSSTIYDIAVVDLLPGGLEIIRDSFDTGNTWFVTTEAREDRALFYFNLEKAQNVIFSYKAKVTAEGTFTVAPVFAEAMYDRNVYGHSKAFKLTFGK